MAGVVNIDAVLDKDGVEDGLPVLGLLHHRLAPRHIARLEVVAGFRKLFRLERHVVLGRRICVGGEPGVVNWEVGRHHDPWHGVTVRFGIGEVLLEPRHLVGVQVVEVKSDHVNEAHVRRDIPRVHCRGRAVDPRSIPVRSIAASNAM
jgi:hypothetical protein